MLKLETLTKPDELFAQVLPRERVSERGRERKKEREREREIERERALYL